MGPAMQESNPRKYMTTGQGESEGVSSRSGCGGKARIQDTHCDSSPKTTQTGQRPQQNRGIYTQAQGWLLNCWRSRPNLSQFTAPSLPQRSQSHNSHAIAATKSQTIFAWLCAATRLEDIPTAGNEISRKYSHDFACSLVVYARRRDKRKYIPTTATKSRKYSHDFALCMHDANKEIYSHGCNKIAEIFPRFCRLWWLCCVSTRRDLRKHSHGCNEIAETFPRFCLVVVVGGL